MPEGSDTVFFIAMTRPSPFPAAAGDAARRVRDAIDRAGYDEPRVLEVLGTAALPSFRRRRALQLAAAGPLETLVKLFLLREPVSPGAAASALEPASPEDGLAAGLLQTDPQGLRAAVELTPFEGLVVAADWPGTPAPDPLEVMGIASSTRALAALTVRRPAAHSLDLGTGSGILALLAAAHSRRVVATDRNPRALDFARFNAQWNGISNVTFRAGDLFEPVSRETFDLVVCNPPFVIAPGVGYLHTHSGRSADALCREIVRAAPARLAEGGLCQLVCNWALGAAESWQNRVAEWLTGSGCDAWVLHSHTEDAADYARDRIAETAEGPEPPAGRLEEWKAYYRREGIEAVGFGVITMRKREGSSHVLRCDRLADIAAVAPTAAGKTAALRSFLEGAIAAPPSESRN